MANEYSINAKITADSTGFEKGIKSAQNSLKGFSSSISSAMKLAGGLFAVGSIAQLGKALSDMSQSYAKATQNIVRGTGAVGEQLKTLQKSVNASLINGVGRDASELGEMVADLNTRLGVTGDTLTELVSQFDDFSNVTGTDTKTAINSVSDVLAKWNIETSQTVPLLDQLTAASQASGASVTELTNGLKSGQAVFSQFGMSATESIAFLGTLKKNGIDTSSAIMGMKTALANFAKSGLDAKTAFAEISESIKNAGSQTEALSIATQTFGQRNGAEFVRILSGGTDGVEAFTEALENAGGTLARTNEASRTSADALKDLKATIAGVFATSGADNGLRDLIDDVAKAIRNFDFTSIKETFSNIGLFIQGVWGQIKELFNNLSGAIDITGGNFKIFADIIYDNLNSAYQTIQDLVGMISAILNGDWSVAWEYAKLIVLRTVKQMEKSVNNAIKLMPNLFNSVIEGYNWVLKQQDKLFIDIFHLPEKYFKSAKLPKFEGKDIIDTKSIDEAIEKVRRTIETKTGKAADITLKDLEKQKKAVHKTTQSITADIGDLGTAVEDTTKTTGKKITSFFEEWGKQYEDLAGNWNETFVDMANIGTETMGDMFTMLGENLAGAGHGYEDFAATATEALSEVLKGLAAQLSALAVTKAVTFQWGQAAIAAAGAAAALVAAGALKNTSKSIKDVGDAAEKSAGSLEEFMKKMEQIKEGTYGQEAGLLQLGQAQLAREIEEAKKKRDEWEQTYNEYNKMRNEYLQNYYAEGLSRYKYQRKKMQEVVSEIDALMKNAWDKRTEFNDVVSKLKSQYTSAPTETLNRLKDEVAGVQDVIYSYRSLYNSVEAYYSLSEKVNSYSKKDQETARRYNELLQKYSVSVARQILKQEGYNLTINARFLAQLLNNLKKYQNSVAILEESIVKDIETLRQDVTTSLISIGKDIGEQFVGSIIDGTKSTDFMENMKKTIRSYMMKMAIYTESFSKKMAEIGSKLIVAISDGGNKTYLTTAKEELLALYETAEKTAKKLDNTLDDVFGKTSESADNATNSLTKFGNTMKDLLDSIQDLGGDIASNLVDALSNGLTQSDFLGNMKTWLRNMMIQMVVYTDTMKAEVEEIGKRISEGLTSGFTDTSLHEIRRDLSYIFEQTSSKMANLDTILGSVFSGYATGTENASRGLHLVGEAGPELVQFKGGERVFNNRDTISMMSGGSPSNNFNVTFNNLQDTSAFAMMSQLKQYQREMAFNAVI